MDKKKQRANRAMAALPLLLFAVASFPALLAEASGSAVQSPAPQQSTKKSSSPSEAPSSSSPAFPSHYFDRSTPPLTIRHVSSSEGDLHPPPPPPPARHARLHHPLFPPPSLRRRPSQGGPGGETAPPYAVQMEPLVKYSPRDPLYANEGGATGEDKKEEQRLSEGPEKEPSQSLDGDEEEAVEDQEGGAATLRALHAEEKSSSGHPVHHFPGDSGDSLRVPFSYHSPPSHYGPHNLHGHPPFPQGPRYVILREPEPIIEIIVKESNQTLPAPPLLPSALAEKPREPVHVFYVKYERKKGKSGGEGERVVFDTPVPAISPSSPVPLPPVHIPEEIEGVKRSPLPVASASPSYAPPIAVETTTLRAVIRPESETVHLPHARSSGLRVTFGEERAHAKDSEVVEEGQSAPQPSFAAPTWSGTPPSPVPPFRHLPEQHFRAHQGSSRYFALSQQQQFGPPQQNQFSQQQHREGQSPDSRAFPPLQRSPPLPPPGQHSTGQNHFVHGQSLRSSQSFPPPQYHPELQQQQAHLRQQQLQQFQHQNQQKHFLQFQEQQKQQQGFNFQRLPTQLPPGKVPGLPSFHVAPPPPSLPPLPPPQQHHQLHHVAQHVSTAPPFIRLPNRQGERYPDPTSQGTPAPGGEIIKSISHSEQHQVQSPVSQGHSLPVDQRERNQPPKGISPDPQFTRNQPGSAHRPLQPQPPLLRQHYQQPQPGPSEFNRQQATTPNYPPQPQRLPHFNSGPPQAGHERFNGARPDGGNQHSNGVAQQQQHHPAVSPSPTPGSSYGTTVVHYPTTPANTAQQINSLRGHQSGPPRSTTPQPPPTTTPTTTTTTHKLPELPDEIPDDLRQQLLSSGILSNADIQILDYDKIGDIPIESLSPEALSGLAGSGIQVAASENKPVAVAAPHTRDKEAVEMKVVRYTPGSEEGAVSGLIRDDVEETRVLAPVTTSQEGEVSEEGFRRYLPLRISGERFPVPDVPELRGRNVTSVVVLAPVGFPDRGRERRAEEEVEKRVGEAVEGEAEDLLSSGRLNALVKNPSGENFKEWLQAEKKASPEEQAVVLLVSPREGQPEEKGDIFMLDVGSGHVSQLRGELSAAFVQVAKANARDSGLELESRSAAKSRR